MSCYVVAMTLAYSARHTANLAPLMKYFGEKIDATQGILNRYCWRKGRSAYFKLFPFCCEVTRKNSFLSLCGATQYVLGTISVASYFTVKPKCLAIISGKARNSYTFY